MKILLVDDHKIFREGVSDILAKEEFASEIIQAADVTEAKQKISASVPDLLITDLSLPGEPGQELIRWIRENSPATRILCMSMHSDITLMREVLSLGAAGFVTKESGFKELAEAIRRVHTGEIYLDQIMLKRVLEYLDHASTFKQSADPALGELSEREREVFFLLIEGTPLQEISDKLFISTKTIENHRSKIYKKLGVHDRLTLINFAREKGMVE